LLMGLRSKILSSEHETIPTPIKDSAKNLNIFFIYLKIIN
jgi:hypothetical protein